MALNGGGGGAAAAAAGSAAWALELEERVAALERSNSDKDEAIATLLARVVELERAARAAEASAGKRTVGGGGAATTPRVSSSPRGAPSAPASARSSQSSLVSQSNGRVSPQPRAGSASGRAGLSAAPTGQPRTPSVPRAGSGAPGVPARASSAARSSSPSVRAGARAPSPQPVKVSTRPASAGGAGAAASAAARSSRPSSILRSGSPSAGKRAASPVTFNDSAVALGSNQRLPLAKGPQTPPHGRDEQRVGAGGAAALHSHKKEAVVRKAEEPVKAADAAPPRDEPLSPRVLSEARLKGFFPPSTYTLPRLARKAPALAPELAYVYGYNGRMSSNVCCANENDVVYPAGCLVVVQDRDTGAQRYFRNHNAEVVSLSVARKKGLVASAQAGAAPYIRVWSSRTLETVRHIQVHEHDIDYVCFSHDEAKLFSVGVDQGQPSLIMWELAADNVITQLCCLPLTNQSAIKTLAASPVGINIAVGGEGKCPLEVWSLTPSNILQSAAAAVSGDVSAACFGSDGALFCGTSMGHIYIFSSELRVVREVVHSAEEPVTALCYSDGLLVSGGFGGEVKCWNVRGNDISAFRRFEFFEENIRPSIQSLAVAGSVLLVGTSDCEIVEVKLNDTDEQKFLVQGHNNTVCGLAVHPNEPLFATCSFDKSVRVWNAQSKSMTAVLDCSEFAMCCCFSPDGKALAVGFTTGRFAVTNIQSLNIDTEAKRRSEAVFDIRFSENGTRLAVASQGVVDVYSTIGWTHVRELFALSHEQVLHHIDWSRDGRYLQCSTESDEYLVWDVESGNLVVDVAALADVAWATWTCHVGWPVCGVRTADGGRISACNVAKSGRALAVSTGRGHIYLYEPPCESPKNGALTLSGHAGLVSNVRFMPDSRTLLSVGGDDGVIVQWLVGERAPAAAVRKS